MSKEAMLPQSAVVHVQSPAHTPEPQQTDRSERRFRRASAWLVLYLLLQAELGLAWDRNWHDYLGRDQFWIPPHIMIYSGIGAAGLVALAVVLIESVRYILHKSGVDDHSTVTVFRIFHAPLGFTITGFGALVDLIAAPLDNYWHQLYGIDVTLWSPFHIMGTIGGLLTGLGMLYAFASEAAIERERKQPKGRFLGLNSSEWGLLIIFASIIEIALPTLTAFQPFALGPWQMVSYPLPLVCAGSFCLVSAFQSTRKPGTATLTALLLWLESSITQVFVIWGLHFAVTTLGLVFRFGKPTPVFNTTLTLLPLLFLINALLVDGMAFWNHHRLKTDGDLLRVSGLLGALMAIPTLIIPPGLALALLYILPIIPLPQDILRTFVYTVNWSNLLFTLPLALAIGATGAWLGAGLGDIWHWSER